jgi:hypothetical protein
MVTGKITDIGTVTFSKKPLVTLSIPGSDEGLKFIFENTDSNNDELAALNIGKIDSDRREKCASRILWCVFLDDSILMSDMISKEPHKQRQILVASGGIFDRVICRK